MRFSVAALSLARYPFSVCIYSARGQCFIVSSFSTTASKSPKAHRRRLRHCRMSSLDIWDKQRPYSDENPYQAMSRISPDLGRAGHRPRVASNKHILHRPRRDCVVVLPPHADVVQSGRLPERFDELCDCGRCVVILCPHRLRDHRLLSGVDGSGSSAEHSAALRMSSVREAR